MFEAEVVEKIKTRIMLNNLFPKIVPFVRECGKNIVKPGKSQIILYYGAYVFRAV